MVMQTGHALVGCRGESEHVRFHSKALVAWDAAPPCSTDPLPTFSNIFSMPLTFSVPQFTAIPQGVDCLFNALSLCTASYSIMPPAKL